MKKLSKIVLMSLGISIMFSGCVTKMIGGAVDIVTFGIVKNDKTNESYQPNKVERNS